MDSFVVTGQVRDNVIGDFTIFNAAAGKVGLEEWMSKGEGAGSSFEVDKNEVYEYDQCSWNFSM